MQVKFSPWFFFLWVFLCKFPPGHYIPYLASEILKRDKSPSKYSTYVKLKLKGILIGGPYLEAFEDYYSLVVLNYHYVISSETFERYENDVSQQQWKPLFSLSYCWLWVDFQCLLSSDYTACYEVYDEIFYSLVSFAQLFWDSALEAI